MLIGWISVTSLVTVPNDTHSHFSSPLKVSGCICLLEDLSPAQSTAPGQNPQWSLLSAPIPGNSSSPRPMKAQDAEWVWKLMCDGHLPLQKTNCMAAESILGGRRELSRLATLQDNTAHHNVVVGRAGYVWPGEKVSRELLLQICLINPGKNKGAELRHAC